MTYSNGLIPRTTLVAVNDGRLLRADAAAAFRRLDEAFRAVFGKRVVVTDGYRDLAQQVAVKDAKGAFAATPGKSNHGWGIALDLGSGINSSTSAEHRWMDANAHRFGWINPTWARDNNPSNGQFEPWHWEYVAGLDQYDGLGDAATPRPAITTPTITLPEDDMTPDEHATLLQIRDAVVFVTGDPWAKALDNKLNDVIGEIRAVATDVRTVRTAQQYPGQPFDYAPAAHNAIARLIGDVAALQAAVAQVAAGNGSDPAAIEAAARAGAEAALKGITITLDTDGA